MSEDLSIKKDLDRGPFLLPERRDSSRKGARMAEKKLTVKQKRFVDFYVETGNATEAAKKAGYSKRTAEAIGLENLGKPRIKKAIAARLKELESKRVATAKEVMEFLTSTMRGEVTEEVVVSDFLGDGVSQTKIVEKHVGVRDRLKAAEGLAKRLGLTEPEDTTEETGGVQIVDDTNKAE